MQRIGHLGAELFGRPEAAPSGEGYRLRSRLHVTGRGTEARVGYFTPGTHRVVDASACQALSRGTRAVLGALQEAIAESGVEASEAAILEDLPAQRRLVRVTAEAGERDGDKLAERLSRGFEGVRLRSPQGRIRLERGARRLALDVGGRRYAVSVDAFFQGNRDLVGRLWADVESEAARSTPGDALDAFGGAGLFAGALLSAGHRVTSVEVDAEAVEDARATRRDWPDGNRWEPIPSALADFLRADDRAFDAVVADPPRAGLGTELASALARRTRRCLLYVSCDPATLARDLPAIRAEGLEIRETRLYDLFAFTHRVEALVVLERPE